MEIQKEIGIYGMDCKFLNVRVLPEQRAQLDAMHKKGINRSHIVRLALKEFFAKLEKSSELQQQ